MKSTSRTFCARCGITIWDTTGAEIIGQWTYHRGCAAAERAEQIRKAKK